MTCRTSAVVALLAGALLAGCGSTVTLAGSGGEVAATNGNVGLGGTDTATLSGPGASTPGGSAPGSQSSLSTEPTPAAAGGDTMSGSVGTGGGGASAATGRGFDASHVYVGFPTNNDASGAAKNLGLAGLGFGDQIAQVNAVVAALNKRGGLLGRTVVAQIHDLKTANLQASPANEAQATCTYFTQDRPVVAVVNIVAAIDIDTFYSCLAKKQTPVFSGGFVPADGMLLRQYAPYLYKLPAADFDVFGPAWLDRLTARRYFSGWDAARGASGIGAAKMGLLYADAQPSKRIFGSLERQLKSRGIAVASTFAYDVSSISNEAGSLSSAVLNFRSAGVTHVLADASDVELFMTAADSQGFKPRYGLNSYLAPQLQAGNAPGQLAGSIGLGWIPQADVAAAQNPGPVSSGETRCRAIMKGAGQDISNYGTALVAFDLCDGVGLLELGVNAAGKTEPRALRAALGAVGARFAPSLTFVSGISASSASLSGAGRDFAWDTGCACFRYLDKINRPW